MPPKRTAAQVLDNLRNINEVLSGDDDSENDDERGISIDNDDDYILEENSSDTDTEDHVDLVIDQVISNVSNHTDETKYISKSGLVWSKINNNEYCKCRNRIVYTQIPGVTNYAKKKIDESALSAFTCIFDNKMIKDLTVFTNKEADLKCVDFKICDFDVLLFIGILLSRGVFCQKMSIKCMWDSLYGINIVRRLMGRDKCLKLMRFLRFDDKSIRRVGLVSDKFVMIRALWERFIDNSNVCYIPGRDLTVDEQLLPCKSRCPFTQFMANKPDKFGIKFWLLCDVKSKYICNGYPYLGADNNKNPNDLVGESVVKKLMEPFYNKGYFVTTDNFFTTYKLGCDLLKQKTTFLGTIRRDKKDLPNVVKIKQKIHETIFCDDEKGSLLTIYQGKKEKNVVLLSTHNDQALIVTENNPKCKANTILTYNKTKVGVDSVDQMSRQYSVQAPSRRWPVAVFYNILNLSIINSWIIYNQVNQSQISRRNYIIKLIEEINEYANKNEQNKVSTPVSQKRFAENSSPTSPSVKRTRLNLILNQSPKHRITCQIMMCNKNKSIGECNLCKKLCCGSCTYHVERVLTCKNCKK